MPLLNQKPGTRTKVFKRDPRKPAKPALAGDFKSRDPSVRKKKKDLINQLPEDRIDLVIDNHLLARKIAHDMVSRHNLLHSGEQYDDIEAEAFFGLIKAAARYDPEHRAPHGGFVKFSSFAVLYIRGEILHYLRDRTYLLKISHNTKELWQKGKNYHWAGVPAIEIAENLGVPLEKWLLAVASCSGPPMPIMEHAKLVDPPEVEESFIGPFIADALEDFNERPIPLKSRVLQDLSVKTITRLSPETVNFLRS